MSVNHPHVNNMLMKVQRNLVAADVRTAPNIMRTLLLFLLLSAVLDVSFSQGFIYVSSTMTWYEAQRYCREVYSDLATITDMTDEDEVMSYTGGTGKVWIGLYRVNNVSPWIWSDQSNFLFNRWAAGQPNNDETYQTCVATTIDGWQDALCTEPYTFVCYSGAAPLTVPPTASPIAPSTAPPTAPPTAAPFTAPPTAPPTAAPFTAPHTATPTTAPPTSSPTTAPPSAPPTAPPNAPPTAPPTAAPTGPPTAAPSTAAPPTSSPTAAPPTEKKRQVLRVEVKSDENVNDPEVKKKVLEKIQHVLNMKGLEGNVTLSWRNQSDGNVFQKKQQNKETQHTCH